MGETPAPGAGSRGEILTIGHSTRSAEELIRLLTIHGVRRLVDVRTVPRSARNPQFGREALAASLAAAGLGYLHVPALGGLRKPRPDSRNTAWRNEGFRGYADYMETEAFERALGELIERARRERIVVMCAEAVPWRCHRSLLADALVARGVPVRHVLGPGDPPPHRLSPHARVDAGGRVGYPGTGDLWEGETE